MKQCAAPECERPSRTQNTDLCEMHRQRMRLWGSLDLRPEAEKRRQVRAAIDALVARCLSAEGMADGECWEWPGPRNARGYGVLGVRIAGTRIASRVVWIKRFGEPADGLNVCHRCDNPPCVRPSHLFLGTTHENALDMVAKDREPSGERNAAAKLTERDVIEIRRLFAAGHKKQHLATRYGVSRAAIRFVVTGQTWRKASSEIAS